MRKHKNVFCQFEAALKVEPKKATDEYFRIQKEQLCTVVMMPVCGKASGSMCVFGYLWLIPASAACPWRFLLAAEPNMQHCPLPALLHANPHAWLAANPSLVLVICLTKLLQHLLCDVWSVCPLPNLSPSLPPVALSFCFCILLTISSYSWAIPYPCVFHHICTFSFLFRLSLSFSIPLSLAQMMMIFFSQWMFIHTWLLFGSFLYLDPL